MAVERLPKMTAVTCASADTEYTLVSSAATRRLSIKARDVGGTYPRISIALTTGLVAGGTGNHVVLESGRALSMQFNGGDTLYIASATAGGVVDVIEEWFEC